MNKKRIEERIRILTESAHRELKWAVDGLEKKEMYLSVACSYVKSANEDLIRAQELKELLYSMEQEELA